jgi:hypothetical protein
MRFDQLADRSLVAEKIQGLFQAVEVIGANENGGWPTIARNDDAFVLALDSVDELRESIFHVPQGISRHGYNCATVFQDFARLRDEVA